MAKDGAVPVLLDAAGRCPPYRLHVESSTENSFVADAYSIISVHSGIMRRKPVLLGC